MKSTIVLMAAKDSWKYQEKWWIPHVQINLN